MGVGGLIAGWFVARDAPNFTFIQMVITLILIVAGVAVLAFWPKLFKRRNRTKGSDR